MRAGLPRKGSYKTKTLIFNRKLFFMLVVLLLSSLASVGTLGLTNALVFRSGFLDAERLCKLAVNTTLPAFARGSGLKNEKAGDATILNALLGISALTPQNVIGVQVSAFAVGQQSIVQASAGNTQENKEEVAETSNNEPAATPDAAPTTTPEEPQDNTDYPITEVRTVVGKLRNDGKNKNIYLNNNTDYPVNMQEMLDEKLKIKPQKGKPYVLLVHTHTTESYSPSGQNTYRKGDSTRTRDPANSVVRVGDEIEKSLKDAGINVIHDTTINDYPSYNGSYKKTLGLIEDYLKKYPSIQVVVDVHRDGIIREDGTKLKICADVGGQKAAQVMLVMGSAAGGLPHEGWRENLKLGLRIQDKLTTAYPGLARPVSLVRERYNQHATPGSMIVEVGSDGNTLEEAVLAGKYFGKSMAEALKAK